MSRPALLVATRNPAKLAELERLLAGLAFDVVPAAARGVGEVEEDGETFFDNALLKAKAAYLATGEAALADDSGLTVDALGGAPGVRSARFGGDALSGEARNAKLLRALVGVPAAERGAAFVCSIALLLPAALVGPDPRFPPVEAAPAPDGAVLFALSGRVEGRILQAPRGEGGFGYDPLFFHAPSGRTFAELSAEEKDRVSHRGEALRKVRACLDAVLRV